MEYETRIPNDMIPTLDTKIRLAGGKLVIPALGIGTWAWGDSLYWGYGTYDTELSEYTIELAFEELISKGLLFFDTAEVYGSGKSEKILGNLIQKYHTKFQRKRIVVATKWFPWPWRLFMPYFFLNPLKESLDRLGLQSTDLYQIHCPLHIVSVEKLANLMADSIESGLIKAVGVSNYSLTDMKRMHLELKKRGIQLASNQIQFSLIRNRPETSGFLQECYKLGISALAFSPLGMGVLTGKYNNNNKPPGLRRFTRYGFTEMDPLLKILKETALNYDKSMAQIAVNWVICKGAIPLVGVKNITQAVQTTMALGWRLKNKDIEKLDMFALSGASNFIYADSC